MHWRDAPAVCSTELSSNTTVSNSRLFYKRFQHIHILFVRPLPVKAGNWGEMRVCYNLSKILLKPSRFSGLCFVVACRSFSSCVFRSDSCLSSCSTSLSLLSSLSTACSRSWTSLSFSSNFFFNKSSSRFNSRSLCSSCCNFCFTSSLLYDIGFDCAIRD